MVSMKRFLLFGFVVPPFLVACGTVFLVEAFGTRTRFCSTGPFGVSSPFSSLSSSSASPRIGTCNGFRVADTRIFLSDEGGGGGGGGTERQRRTKKGLTTIVIEKTEEKLEQIEKREEEWRVILHNDEIHTFMHVIKALTKVVKTLDRKRAFDIAIVTHGTGKATITRAKKKKAEKFCLGLQRQGLTVSIAPESRFSNKDGDGGDGGGGGDGGDGGGGGGQ